MPRTTTIQLGDLKRPAQERATVDGTSVSEVVRRALAAYLGVPYPERHDLGAMVRASLASRAIPQIEEEIKGQQALADEEEAKWRDSQAALETRDSIVTELSFDSGLSAVRLQELTGIDPISCEVALGELVSSGEITRDRTGAYVLARRPVEIGG